MSPTEMSLPSGTQMNTTAPDLQPSTIATIAYYCNYAFVTFGALCNIIAVICLYKSDSPKEKNNTVRYYLIVLAVCDGLFVFWLSLLFILNGLGNPFYLHWETCCNLIPLLTMCTSQLSSLLVMMITVNRFVAIFFPLKFKHLQSIGRIYSCIGILILVVIIINWYSFGGLKPIDKDQLDTIQYFEYQCRGRTQIIDDYYFHIFPWIDLTVYFIIPGLVLLVFNIAFAIRLRHLGRIVPVNIIQGSATTGGSGRSETLETPIDIVNDRSDVTSQHQPRHITYTAGQRVKNTKDKTNQRLFVGKDSSRSSHCRHQEAASITTAHPCSSERLAMDPKPYSGTSNSARCHKPARGQVRVRSVSTSDTKSLSVPCNKYLNAPCSTDSLAGNRFHHNVSLQQSAPVPQPMYGSPAPVPTTPPDTQGKQPNQIIVTPIANATSLRPMPHRLQQRSISPSTVSSEPCLSSGVDAAPQSNHIRQGRHMTRICIVMSLSFLLLAFPMVCLRLAILMNLADAGSETVDSVYQFASLLLMSNHVINFWVYCVCWKEFRQRALNICKTLSCRPQGL